MIQVHEVIKTFDGKEILRNLNLNVERGTIYGLLGANGAGKTTTFKLISGLLQPTAGSIHFSGEVIQTQNKEFLKEMGVLIETPVFYEHLSAGENLEIHLAYMGCDTADIDNSLQVVGLADTGKKAVSKFSLGMKQRLAIARAISHTPKLLVLDEPVNGLDFESTEFLYRQIAGYKEYGTVLFSSHILESVTLTADRVLVLENGQIRQTFEDICAEKIREVLRYENAV